MKGTAGDYPTRREATRQQPFHLLPQSFIRAGRGGHVPFHTAGTIQAGRQSRGKHCINSVQMAYLHRTERLIGYHLVVVGIFFMAFFLLSLNKVLFFL